MRILGKRGFTVLEVMIATAVFAISISIVYGLYGSIVTVVENVEVRMQRNHRVMIAFTRISRDLQGLYRGAKGYLISKDSTDPNEGEPVLEFVSSAYLSFDPDTAPVPLSIIRFYIEQNEEDNTSSLLRSETPFTFVEQQENVQEGRKFRVSEGLIEVRLRYLDREDYEQSIWDTNEGTEEEQQEDGRFPRLVKIDLIFASNNSDNGEGPVYSAAVQLRPALIRLAGGIDG